MKPGSSADNYQQILLSAAPLIDLRAPGEFAKGSFPGAVNLPLMNDTERQKVGTCYKNQGQQAAIALGHQLVSGKVKQQRLAAWRQFIEAHPHGYLFCFRGGLRSHTVQHWLAELGYHYPLISGGYKAMRRYLMESSEAFIDKTPVYLLSGLTGSAKTPLLKKISHSIDLEAIANHRGSSFGQRFSPQPVQINFENNLAIALLRSQQKQPPYLLLEDESRLIGSCALPFPLFMTMKQAALIVVEESIENRVDHIYQEYIEESLDLLNRLNPETAFGELQAYLLRSLGKMQKRLGDEQYRSLSALIEQAVHQQTQQGQSELHRVWIQKLLENYYDPMYSYQLSKKQERVIFKGSKLACVRFIEQLNLQI